MSGVQFDMDEVREGVYVGCWQAAENTENLINEGIKYILTLGQSPLEAEDEKVRMFYKDNPRSGDSNRNLKTPSKIWRFGNSTVVNFVYKFVQVLDEAEADLLSHFDECFKFINEAVSVKDRKILIHCVAGVSRSATIAIAYMMHTDKMSLKKALTQAKQRRPRVGPNDGFMEQLELFEWMGGVIDPSHDLYRKYKLGVMAQKVQTGGFDEVKESDLGTVSVDGDKTEAYYKCRKCRQSLFRRSSILPHNVGQGEAAFDWRSKVPASKRPAGVITENQSEKICDQSLFIEPVKWMAGIINELEGKLMCPKCQNKLGSFIWYGEKCPCGSWVAPAFHIQSSKVDIVKPRPQMGVNQSGAGKITVVQSEAKGASGDQSDARVKPS